MSVNLAILMGNLGRDPEVRYMSDGKAVANFSIATTESWKDKSGDKKEKTEWHRCTVYGKTAEIAGEYLKKGSQVHVTGKITTREWEDKQGQKRQTTEIVVDKLTFVSTPKGSGGKEATATSSGDEEGIPF